MRNHIYDWDQDHPGTKWIVSIGLLLIALLFGASSARGQFGVEQPMFASPTAAAEFTPTNIAGARFWWVSEDVEIGERATNWIDRIYSLSWTNTAAVAPTNSNDGLWFDGSNGLRLFKPFVFPDFTVSSLTYSSFYVVFKAASQTTIGHIIGCDTGGNYAGGRGMWATTTGDLRVNGSIGTEQNVALFTAGTIMDVGCIMTNNTGSAWYTNGIVSKITNLQELSFVDLLGQDPPANFYKGTILEVIFFTNVTFSASEITQLHNYATNKYGFSP